MIAQIQYDDDKRIINAGAYAITDNQLFRYGKPVMMDTEFESVYACLHAWHMMSFYNPDVLARIENAMHESESVAGVFGADVSVAPDPTRKQTRRELDARLKDLRAEEEDVREKLLELKWNGDN